MDNYGFTLLELLITLAIITILLSVGIPSFSNQVQHTRVKTTALKLLDAMELTRTQAVMANTRTTLKAHGTWENGWDIFIDGDNNGIRDEGEKLIVSSERFEHVLITPNRPVKHYISYIGSGEARMDGEANAGAFQAGTITICPRSGGNGYQLILARGGRVRMQDIKAEQCSEQQ